MASGECGGVTVSLGVEPSCAPPDTTLRSPPEAEEKMDLCRPSSGLLNQLRALERVLDCFLPSSISGSREHEDIYE